MMPTNYKLNFEKLCATYNLGSLRTEPEQIFGGFLHRMYRMTTDQAEYAVKALNPQIMLRESVMNNLTAAEKAAELASRHGINALPALLHEGSCMHEVDGQYYLLFPWIQGRSISADNAGLEHCVTMGKLSRLYMPRTSLRSIMSSIGIAQRNNCRPIGKGMPYKVRRRVFHGPLPLWLLWTSSTAMRNW